MKRKKVVNSRFAKTPEYKEVIGAIEREGKCPFCPQNFKYHKNPVLKKRGVWFLTKSSWAYRNSHLHFLIVGKKHKERVEELKDGDLKNIFFLVRWAIKNYDIKGGGFALRFGDTEYTGATVCHIHVHLIVPEKGKTVNFPIG